MPGGASTNSIIRSCSSQAPASPDEASRIAEASARQPSSGTGSNDWILIRSSAGSSGATTSAAPAGSEYADGPEVGSWNVVTDTLPPQAAPGITSVPLTSTVQLSGVSEFRDSITTLVSGTSSVPGRVPVSAGSLVSTASDGIGPAESLASGG